MKYIFAIIAVLGCIIQSSYSGLIFDDRAPDLPQTEIWAVQSNARNTMNGLFLGNVIQYLDEYKKMYKECYKNFVKRYKLVAEVLDMNMKQCGKNINSQLPMKYLAKVNHLRAELDMLAGSAIKFGEQLEEMVKNEKFENVKGLREKWSDWAFHKFINFHADMLFIRKHKQQKAEELIKYVTYHVDESGGFAWKEGQDFEKCLQKVNSESNFVN